MTVRKDLEVLLQERWADIDALAGVRIIATERDVTVGSKPLAIIRQKSIAKTPQAPRGSRTFGMVITLVSPLKEPDNAADQLDDLAEAALDDLDRIVLTDEASAVTWGTDEQGNPLFYAYDIPIHVLATKTQPESPEED